MSWLSFQRPIQRREGTDWGRQKRNEAETKTQCLERQRTYTRICGSRMHWRMECGFGQMKTTWGTEENLAQEVTWEMIAESTRGVPKALRPESLLESLTSQRPPWDGVSLKISSKVFFFHILNMHVYTYADRQADTHTQRQFKRKSYLPGEYIFLRI